MSFDVFSLDPSLLRAIATLGFVKPTAIQNEVLPIALLGKDIMASAPTGSKTAAYLLPAFQHLMIFHVSAAALRVW